MIRILAIALLVLGFSVEAQARSHRVCAVTCQDVPFTAQEETAQDAIEAAAASAIPVDPKDAAITSAFTAQNSVLKALLTAINNGQLTAGQNLTAAQLKTIIKSNM